jgi:predicted secreted protein
MVRIAVAVAAVALVVACVACTACRHGEVPAESASVDAGSGGSARGAPEAGASPRAAPTAGPIVQVADDGKTFALARGGVLTFSLARNAGTGFEWSPAPLDGGVLMMQGERASERTSDEPGAAKNDVYRFLAGEPGTVTVEMQLRRPWGDQPPVKTLRVVVEVR